MTLPHGAILPEKGGEEEEREALERFLDLSQVSTLQSWYHPALSRLFHLRNPALWFTTAAVS